MKFKRSATLKLIEEKHEEDLLEIKDLIKAMEKKDKDKKLELCLEYLKNLNISRDQDDS